MRSLSLFASVLMLILCSVNLNAAPFIFQETNAPPDTLLAFRQAGSSFEMVVNIGSIERFTKAADGTSFELTEYSTNQLAALISSLNGVTWSVAAALKPSTPKLSEYPVKTLWLTRGRIEPQSEAKAWERKSQFTQASSESRITSYGNGAQLFSSLHAPGPQNTSTAVVMPSDYTSGYSAYVGSGNLKNTFQGVIENTTPADFLTAGVVSRSDLFELIPGSGPGRRVGHFELRPDGTMRFFAAGGTANVDVTPPVVTTLSPTPGSITNLSRITVVFSEPVSGVQASDLRVNDQPAVSASGNGARWEFEVPPGLSGTVQLAWANPNGIFDLATTPNRFNPEGEARSWTYQIVPIETPKVTLKIVATESGWSLTTLSTVGTRYQLVAASWANLIEPVLQWSVIGLPKDGTGLVLEWSGSFLESGQAFALRRSN